jgi:cytochrome c-type biogenesis protein CcmF
MIQEKRGMLKMWNVLLVMGTFLLSIFATFLTRSGLIESVHSFART